VSVETKKLDSNSLPPNWKCVALKEVVSKLVDGSHNPPSKKSSGYPMLSARNIENNKIVYDDYRLISKTDYELEHKRTKIAPGDVLLTIVGTIGRSAIVPEGTEPLTLQRSVAVITPAGLLPKFLMYQFQAPFIQRYFEAQARGTAQKGVYLGTLGETPICVAPIDEQKDIVAEIEKQFSRLDEAVANLKRVKANLKRYKAAVLKAAVEGKFVNEQDGKWQNTTIGDVTELVTKGSSPNWQGFDYVEKGIVFVRSQNVGWGNLDLSDVAHLPSSFNLKEKKSILRTDDVLLNIVGASIGRASVATKQVEGGNINQAVSVIRPSKEHLMPKFLMYYLLSDIAQKLIHSQKVDVARANYSLDQIKKMPLHLPPLAIQFSIVAEVESRFSVIEDMDAVASLNLPRAQRLRQSILNRAFSGNLMIGA
jgi:type I restriction enzyme S subunit